MLQNDRLSVRLLSRKSSSKTKAQFVRALNKPTTDLYLVRTCELFCPHPIPMIEAIVGIYTTYGAGKTPPVA